VRNEFYKDTLGAILVFDTSTGKTFDALDKWVDELKKLSGANPPVVLVANKLDVGPRVVASDEGKAYAEKNGMQYFETSANTGKNVKEMFEGICSQIFNYSFIPSCDQRKES
jgi:DnaJ family protein C protein 27